jgi:hypothetical protein
MVEKPSQWALKIGLFLVLLTWLAYTVFQFGKFLLNGVDVPFTDVPGSIGFGFRTAAAFVAFVTVLFYMVKRDFSKTEALTSLRWIVLLEAAYWLMFLPAAVWGFQYSNIQYSQEFFILEAGLPCLVEAIAMPTVLVVLFFKLNPNKPTQGAIRWALIAATVEIFVLWFNYTSQWWSEFFLQGTWFLSDSHIAIFEFGLTVAGLLVLGVFAAVYTHVYESAQSLSKLNFRRAGIILTALGLYFDIILLIWFVVPDFGANLTIWPTFIVDHNVDLWLVSLPLVGIPLMLHKPKANAEPDYVR